MSEDKPIIPDSPIKERKDKKSTPSKLACKALVLWLKGKGLKKTTRELEKIADNPREKIAEKLKEVLRESKKAL